MNELFNTRQDVYNFAAKIYVGEEKYSQLSKADKKKLRKNFKTVTEIAATPATINLDHSDTSTTATISVIGLKGALYAPIELDNADCTFTSDHPEYATVGEHDGVVTAVAAGTVKITVTYNGKSDEVDVVVA